MNSKTAMPKDDSFFSKCTNCGFEWPSRNQFLEDRMVTIIGYQVNFDNLSMGFFLFNHSCKGTFSLRPDHLNHVIKAPSIKNVLRDLKNVRVIVLGRKSCSHVPQNVSVHMSGRSSR